MRLTRLTLPTAALAVLLTAAVGVSADTPVPPKGTASITGHVEGSDGKPAANVPVRLVARAAKTAVDPVKADDVPAKPKRKKPTGVAPMTTTDAEGNFKFPELAAGTYNVVAGTKESGRVTKQVVLADGKTEDVTLKLSKPAPKP